MISDWEIWACAQEVIKQHGRKALDRIDDRISALTIAKDAEGVATWKAIARRVRQLTDFRHRPGSRH